MTQLQRTSKLHKLRVSASLDFTAGNATPPKRDRGESATVIKRHRQWLGLTWHEWLTVETDTAVIERLQSKLEHLDFETMRELFDAYESQIETYLISGETEKAAKLENFLTRLLDAMAASPDAPIGLSDAIISHKTCQLDDLIENTQQNQGFQKRAKRGSRGITPYAKRLIRSCGVLLEESFGRKNLAFVTCTLPPLDETQLRRVCDDWSEIVRQFFQSLTRFLERKGLSTDYVQVTEIQEKRFKQWGQVCPHLHFVCQSRLHRSEHWRIVPINIERLWQSALENSLGVSVDCRAATRIENPRKSLAAELGKYLSKGGKVVKEILDRGLGAYLPSAWYGASRSLKALERSKRIERVGEVATWLLRHLDELAAANQIWFRKIFARFKCPQTGIEREQCVGVVGRFKSKVALTAALNKRILATKADAA